MEFIKVHWKKKRSQRAYKPKRKFLKVLKINCLFLSGEEIDQFLRVLFLHTVAVTPFALLMDVHVQVYSICFTSEYHYVLNMLTLPAALNHDTAAGTGWFTTKRVGGALEG